MWAHVRARITVGGILVLEACLGRLCSFSKFELSKKHAKMESTKPKQLSATQLESMAEQYTQSGQSSKDDSPENFGMQIDSAPQWALSISKSVESLQAGQSALSQSITEFTTKMDSGSTSIQWKKDGLRRQYEVAEKVVNKLTAAEVSFKAGQNDAALEFISKGKDILLERQHCLRIADTSVGGWETVTEYLTSPLAKSEEDDKRIKKADKVVQERMKEKAEAKKTSRRPYNSPYYRPKNFGFDQPNEATNPTNPLPAENLPAKQQFRTQPMGFQPASAVKNLSNVNQPAFVPGYLRSAQIADICFFCGMRGHWADTCPERKQINKKVSH